jgi:GTPase SAR1 family protein
MGGICQPGDRTEADELAAKKSKVIDSAIHKERRNLDSKVKLLLLGAGDSGKSTFVKQMKVIHKNGFSKGEVDKFVKVLQENCLTSMQKLLQCEEVNIKITGKKLKEAKDNVLAAGTDDLALVYKDVIVLWQEKTVKDAFENRSELFISIPSTSDYFFENAERFASESFQPTPEDMFRAKQKTTGIVEVQFEINKVLFTMVDVGGQRSERRKWLHCFDDVTSIIFLAALDEYDMKLEEDLSTNRLEESLRLFSEVTASTIFQPNSWILFLNKSDLFETKIKKVPLTNFFPDYPRDQTTNFEAAVAFIQAKYQSNFKGFRLYPYVTCALDTTHCKKVFTAVRDIAITGAMCEAGF